MLGEMLPGVPVWLNIEMVVRIVVQVFLICCSSFFSGSETALFSLSRFDLQTLRKEKNPQSDTLHSLLSHPRRLIISILCGNELVNIAAAANLTGMLAHVMGVEGAAVVSTAVMIPLLLLFGEVTPKTIAVTHPVRISTGIVARPMGVWVRLIFPLQWIVRIFADRLTTYIVGKEKAVENLLKVDELKVLVDEGVLSGELDASERSLIMSILRAGGTEVVNIMVPRTKVGFVDGSLPVPRMVEQFLKLRHSRVPVYRGHRDNIIGFIHVEDVEQIILEDADLSSITTEKILRSALVVPPTKQIDEMLDFFQNHEATTAAVLNEFGGIDGIVTMADVLNFIFGPLYGEELREDIIFNEEEGFWEVPGDIKLPELNHIANTGLTDTRMTTVGGLVLRHLDRLPRENDSVVVEGITLKVLEMREHRISRVRVGIGKGSRDEPPEKPEPSGIPEEKS
jgi:CBS domain containing-hemolysin-like protein